MARRFFDCGESLPEGESGTTTVVAVVLCYVFGVMVWYEHTQHEMDFGDDKRFWYGTKSGGPTAVNGVPCSPINAMCAAGMPMYTESKNTGATLKADVMLNDQDLLRVGGMYQHYTLDDWWPPSGAGWTIMASTARELRPWSATCPPFGFLRSSPV